MWHSDLLVNRYSPCSRRLSRVQNRQSRLLAKGIRLSPLGGVVPDGLRRNPNLNRPHEVLKKRLDNDRLVKSPVAVNQ